MDYSQEDNEKKIKSHKSKKKKVTNKAGTIIFRVIIISILVLGFAGVGAGAGIYLAIIQDAPSLSELEKLIQPNMQNSIIYEEKTGKEIDRLIGMENREYVTMDRIPKHLANAFVAIEDSRFYSHDGVDLRGFARAVYVTLSNQGTQGASTITQQLIKNNVMKIMRNTYTTKIQEQYLAVNYEKSLISKLGSKEKAKEQILELYLNSIGLSHGLNGVQAASLRYFNKDVSELTLSESAVIAAITQRPEYYSPIRRPENNRMRQETVLEYMQEQGYISEYEKNMALADDVYSRISDVAQELEESTSYHSYFVDQLITELVDDLVNKENYTLTAANFLVYSGGLNIYATIDTDMQSIVDDTYLKDDLFPDRDYEILVTYKASVKNEVTGQNREVWDEDTVKNEAEIDNLVYEMKGKLIGPDDTIILEVVQPVVQPQSAFVIIDYHTGQVKALSGGRGEKLANRVLNRATASPRQPGSVFKVLASYAPAIDLGIITPATVYDDTPITINGWSPNNWYSNPSYRGLSTVREGIKDSMNVITVKNFMETGADNIFDYLLNFGFTTLVDSDSRGNTDRGPATSLGGITEGVTTMELAAAYGAMANGGELIEPYLYTKVIDADGNPILENTPEPKQVLKSTSAFLLTNMMQDVITAGTGGRARFKEVRMPIAGKTGTTSSTKDLVFAGYTPYYVAAVYLGHDMPKTIVDNNNYHLQIWSHIMEQIHADLPYKDFERPDGIVSASVCKESGQLAAAICNSDPRGSTIITEYFAAGTAPTAYCTVHDSVVIDNVSGLLATEYCPEENKTSIVGIRRPVAYTGGEYIGDMQFTLPSISETCNIHGPNAIDTELDDLVMPEDDNYDMYMPNEEYEMRENGELPNQGTSQEQDTNENQNPNQNTDTNQNTNTNQDTGTSQNTNTNQDTGTSQNTNTNQNTNQNQTIIPSEAPEPEFIQPPVVMPGTSTNDNSSIDDFSFTQ